MSVRHSILNLSGFFSMTSLTREKLNYRLKISKHLLIIIVEIMSGQTVKYDQKTITNKSPYRE